MDLPEPGIEPMFTALAGRFFTIEPPGKSDIYQCDILTDHISVAHFSAFSFIKSSKFILLATSFSIYTNWKQHQSLLANAKLQITLITSNFEKDLSVDATVIRIVISVFYRLWQHWDTYLINYVKIYFEIQKFQNF